jgi:hypothetical protein
LLLLQPLLGGASKPTFSSRLVYLKFVWVPAPPPFSGVQGASPFLLHFLFSSLVFFSFFFSPRQGSDYLGSYAGLSQGWLWGYHVSLICSPVGLHLPCRLGAGIWWCRSPSGFSIYCGMGSYVWAGGLGVLEFCLMVVFPARCVCSISARFLLYRAHAICFLPLVTILDLLFFFFF